MKNIKNKTLTALLNVSQILNRCSKEASTIDHRGLCLTDVILRELILSIRLSIMSWQVAT